MDSDEDIRYENRDLAVAHRRPPRGGRLVRRAPRAEVPRPLTMVGAPTTAAHAVRVTLDLVAFAAMLAANRRG